MYTCRPAQSEDYKTLCIFPESEDELFFIFPSGTFPLKAEQLEDNARNRWCPTVVADENGPVGYANFYGYEEGKHCYLGNFFVAPSHRGMGAAAQLIQAMIEKAAIELKVPRLQLVCHNNNPRALLFYDKFGFTPFRLNRMKNKKNEVVVGIIMGMNL